MKSKIGKILKKELREMFRDKKSLTMMLIIPFLIPLLIFGMSALFEAQINRDVSEYNRIGFAYKLNDIEKQFAESCQINIIENNLEQLKKQYENQEIDLYITKEGNVYTIHGDSNDTTTLATSLAENYLNAYKSYLQQEYLNSNDVDASKVLDILVINEEIAETENYFANYIINYAFLFIIMAITVSATYPATDTTAGEKERGTLETLLTFPIKSKDIIVGKFLSVAVSSIITGIISLILMLISLALANNLFEIYEGVSLILSLNSVLYALLVIIAFSFLISGLCIAIASKSKTFKEAQSALTPLTFISFFPSMIAFMMNLETTHLLACVPFLNFTLLFTDILNNNVSYLNIILMIISTTIVIYIVLAIIIKQYKSEQVLFGN